MTTELQRPAMFLMATATGDELTPVYGVAADRNPALVYLARISEGSRRTMRQALATIADIATAGACDPVTMPWGELRAQHVAAIRVRLAERGSYLTANKMLSALRQVLGEARTVARQDAQAAQARATTADEAVRIAISSQNLQDALTDAIKAARKVAGENETTQAERGRALTYGELMALLGACAGDTSPAGVRDAAIVALFRVGGLRRAEMAGLDLANYDREAQRLTVVGKRNKTRAIPIEDSGARGALADWLHLRGTDAGPLFTRIDREAGGRHVVTLDRLTDQGIYYIVEERRNQAGIEPFTPHDLRRTFAGDLLDAGVDLATVQKLMGHSNPATTAGYDRRGEQAKRKAVTNLHVPYTRRYKNGDK
jgi:integrase/recombinase XerD